eukprot:2834180-Prymnesium_polylepis.1
MLARSSSTRCPGRTQHSFFSSQAALRCWTQSMPNQASGAVHLVSCSSWFKVRVARLKEVIVPQDADVKRLPLVVIEFNFAAQRVRQRLT